MIVSITLSGGLGNRLFMLASAYSVAKRHRCTLHITTRDNDYHEQTDVTELVTALGGHFNDKRGGPELTCRDFENDTVLIDNHIKRHSGVHLKGYFQSLDYFIEDASTLRKCITEFLHQHASQKIRDSQYHDATFIHIRGGDYRKKRFANHMSFDPKSYYAPCLKKSLDNGERIIILTNDKEYANTILSNKESAEMVDENTIDTLYIMSKCKNAVCANSSFSWWGSFLGPSEHGYVLMPYPWILKRSHTRIYPSYAEIINAPKCGY